MALHDRRGLFPLLCASMVFTLVACGQTTPPPPSATSVEEIKPVYEEAPPPVLSMDEMTDAARASFGATVLARASWNPYQDSGAGVVLSQAGETSAPALRLECRFANGKWLGAWKQLSQDLSPYHGVRITYHRTGARNTLEFKIEDADLSCFGLRFPPAADDAISATVDIPFTKLTRWWGGDETLDLRSCKIHFSQSLQAGDPGGSSSWVIDQLELLPKPGAARAGSSAASPSSAAAPTEAIGTSRRPVEPTDPAAALATSHGTR